MFHNITEPHYSEQELIDEEYPTRHLASEPHIRIQVITIPYYEGDNYFEFHGELLLIVQFIWTPGLGVCEECWNIANRFFKK